jgi:excinuclease ABC subunit A
MNTRKTETAIEVRGASTHNLKDVNCRIPHGKLTVVTGVSGSGKSSLAFDTVYAEGQRRYVETLSTYARQFLQQMRKPPVKDIAGLPPALALKQGNHVSNARSTVGTVTEFNDHLHLLFKGAGEVHCKCCGSIVRPYTVRGIVDWLLAHASGERVVILGAIQPAEEESVEVLLRSLAAEGHRRLYHEGKVVEIDSAEAIELLDGHRIEVVVDRMAVRDEQLSRLTEAVEAALAFGDGTCMVVLHDRQSDDGSEVRRPFYTTWRCSECHTQHHPVIPALFNPQSSIGGCASCGGFGRMVGLDMARVIPDPRLTVEDGVIAPFQTRSNLPWQGQLVRACMKQGVPLDVPWRKLPKAQQQFVVSGGDGWGGVTGFFELLNEDRRKAHVRIFIAQYRGYTSCTACDGSGLSEDARAVQVGGSTMADVLAMRVDEAVDWSKNLQLSDVLGRALTDLRHEIEERLRFLQDAGVGYLTLNRQARTLSGGEMHRILLATNVGRLLTDTCYVLDEPTAGLHPADTERLFAVIRRLRDAGNTVVVVEHDPDVIQQADWVIEMGPDAGEGGGHVVFEGTVAELRKRKDTQTGRSLSTRLSPELVAERSTGAYFSVSGACLHNLDGVEAKFPKGLFSVVTGPSGSGKSTLVNDVIFGLLKEARGTASSTPLAPARLDSDDFTEVVMVDQGSISTSSRSCSLTYCGAYNAVRDLFADTEAAKALKLTAGTFSFNTPGGRCDTCEGTGVQIIEMHFMADIELECEVCRGRRFKDKIVGVRWNERSISDVLAMTVSEALVFFESRATIIRRLEPLQRVGLGYLRLGQATSRLSGGELQRLKLSSYLAMTGADVSDENRLFLFDEPTVGLHMRDVDVLVRALRDLTEQGNTVIVVEHNLDLIAASDWVVDLGPGGGPAGGTVVYEGPAAGLVEAADSLTCRYLNESFA